MIYVGGAAGMRNRGTYAAGTQYFTNDLVQYNGSSYIATATTLGNDPTNTSYWSVLATGGGTDTLQSVFVPPYLSQYWYDRRFTSMPGVYWDFALAASTTYYVPMVMHRSVVIDRVALIQSGTVATSGATVRVGYYSHNAATVQPASLLLNLGLVTMSTTAQTVIPITLSGITLPKGTGWWALSCNATAGGSVHAIPPSGSGSYYYPMPSANIGTPDARFTGSNMQFAQGLSFLSETVSAGTLAATAPTSLTSGYNASSAGTPNVFFRVA